MLRIFYKNNGQIAPFMLGVIVILIIAVMLSVNVGKISLTKTHSSNAADAGSLAGASVMANVFNMIAFTNRTMIPTYEAFLLATTFSIEEATRKLWSIDDLANDAKGNAETAKAEACHNPCSARAHADGADQETAEAIRQLGTKDISYSFMWQIAAIGLAVTAYQLDQWNFYIDTRDAALEGHKSALELAFQLAFSNSGISQKLQEGTAPASPVGNADNYQASFSAFVDGINISENPPENTQTYSWTDGQNRTHQVDVKLNLEPPKRFQVRLTNSAYAGMMGYPAEMAVLVAIEGFANSVRNNLLDANMHYQRAKQRLDSACDFFNKYKLAGSRRERRKWYRLFRRKCDKARDSLTKGLSSNNAAIGQFIPPSGIKAIYPLLGLALVGVTSEPGNIEWRGEVTVGDIFLEDILAWIEEVGTSQDTAHPGTVRVETTQKHDGTDLGLWRTRYPDTTSFSVANFRRDRFGGQNRGEIYPDQKLHHDATIVQTD